MAHNRISLVIFGNGESLKKALITNILGKDLSELAKRKTLTKTMIYENETFVFSCTPDLRTPCDDITELLSTYLPPDMCLLVVENSFSTEHVQQQIEDLKKKTGKPTKQFTVVLPMRHKPKDFPFKSCTLEQLIHEVDKLAEKKRQAVPGPDLRIVMIGKTGVGKSAVGNTILRQKHFISRPSPESVTQTCEKGETQLGNRNVCVIDTPGILGTGKSDDLIKNEIVKCIKASCPGPHAFLLVLQIGQFTTEDKNSVEALQELFGPEANRYMIVLFTHGDNLEDTTVHQYICAFGQTLRKVIQSCGSRYHVFNNKSKDEKQVVELIKIIDNMAAVNGDTYYTDAMYKEVEERRQRDGEQQFMRTLLMRIQLFHSTLRRS